MSKPVHSVSQLLEEARRVIREHRFSIRIETSYLHYIQDYIRFHGHRHPARLGRGPELSLSPGGRAKGHRFHPECCPVRIALPSELDEIVPARRPERLPVVFTREEVRAVLGQLQGSDHLLASLLYGSGLRLLDALRLRVKDVDFGLGELLIREGKGNKDRHTMLPRAAREPLRLQRLGVNGEMSKRVKE